MKRVLVLLQAIAWNASAQCVMCYRTAEAQNMARARVLDVGILLLGVPPFVILGGFCWLIHRRSHSYADGPGHPAVRAGKETQTSLSVD